MRSTRKQQISRAEQETVIRWDESAEVVSVYSASPVTWRKCARLGLAVRDEREWPDGSVSGRTYEVLAKQFRWGLKSKRAGNPEALAKARNPT